MCETVHGHRVSHLGVVTRVVYLASLRNQHAQRPPSWLLLGRFLTINPPKEDGMHHGAKVGIRRLAKANGWRRGLLRLAEDVFLFPAKLTKPLRQGLF